MKLSRLIAATLLLAATPATAKEVTLTLSDQQQTALLQVLDKATRDGGLSAANNGTVYFFNLLKQTVDAANAPPPAPKVEAKPAESTTADAPKETPAP